MTTPKPRPPFAHDIKIVPEALNAIVGNVKRAEFRDMKDRDYRVGDILRLHAWDDGTDTRSIPRYKSLSPPTQVEITHIQTGPDFGIPEGYGVLSIRLVEGP